MNAILRRVPPWAVYLVGMLPFVWLVLRLFSGGLGVDPVKPLEHELGRTGLKLLILGLAVTPLRRFAGINLMHLRRVIGLLAFFYIFTHLLVWLLFDIQLRWSEIGKDILKRPYITIGMAAFVMLVPLALTSNNRAVRRMGAATWRRLHRLVYPAALAGGVHYVMVVKGWQVVPLVYLVVIVGLLVMRSRLTRRRVVG